MILRLPWIGFWQDTLYFNLIRMLFLICTMAIKYYSLCFCLLSLALPATPGVLTTPFNKQEQQSASSATSCKWKDICVPHGKWRYKQQIIRPALSGIKIQVPTVSLALYSKEVRGELSLINLPASSDPLHTILVAFPAPKVPALHACTSAARRKGKWRANTDYFCMPEYTGRLWALSNLLSLAAFRYDPRPQAIDRDYQMKAMYKDYS